MRQALTRMSLSFVGNRFWTRERATCLSDFDASRENVVFLMRIVCVRSN